MSINKYIKEREKVDVTYQMFKERNKINIDNELKEKNEIKKKSIFKSKPFKLSISLTILIIISITIVGINNIDNKYDHYQLYEKGNELNKIMVSNNDMKGDDVGGSGTYILQSLNGIFLFYKEPTIFEIKECSYNYYICGYVDNEVKEKIYKMYHLNDSKYYESLFFYDSLFHAYTLCISDDFIYSLEESEQNLYFNQNDYPIMWYIIRKDKEIFESIDDKFLLGVLEIKELVFEGLVSNKTKTKQFFCEKYEYRIEEMNPIERITDRYVKEWRDSLDYERINVNEEKKYINYCGWEKLSNFDFLLEKDINTPRITEIEYYNDIPYINLGNETIVSVYNEEYSFQDSVNCFNDYFVILDEIANEKCKHDLISCWECYLIKYQEKHSDCKCQDKDYLNSLKKDFKDMYEYKTKVNGDKEYYYFKLSDFQLFINVNNHYDMNTLLNPLDIAIKNF